MRLSTADHILTTHTGSLPRPAVLRDAPAGDPEAVRTAVAEVVAKQVRAGVDIVSDGELSKPGYANYIPDRADGFGGESQRLPEMSDAADFPEWGATMRESSDALPLPACVSDVRYGDGEAVARDIANLRDAVEGTGAEGFLTASSPGVVSLFLENQHYPSHDAYLEALSATMREEYEAIHAAGLTVQIDCPDLAMGRHIQYPDKDLQEWKTIIAGHVEALNAATANIPPETMRLHLCWGNYDGPHNHDVPLEEVLELVLTARPAALSFEGANSRHEHEWRVFEQIELPDDKVLIPGVIDSTTNYVEHPRVVADRLERYASIVGPERVIGGSDCGFGTFAGYEMVVEPIVYAKLHALAEGAALASDNL